MPLNPVHHKIQSKTLLKQLLVWIVPLKAKFKQVQSSISPFRYCLFKSNQKLNRSKLGSLNWNSTNYYDSIDQIIKIKRYAPNMKILWRIDIKQQVTDNLSTYFSGKFVDDLDSDLMISRRMREITQMDINLKGIHFHCGSGMDGSSAFGKAIKLARRCTQIGIFKGHQMSILDIGGGFTASDLPKTIQSLKVTKQDPLNYEIIAESGKHFSSRCFYLLTCVFGKRIKNGKPCSHLNDSLYHSFNCT